MENLKCRGETVAKEINEAMKSLPALIEQGEGFSQVLRMQPVIHLQRIHQEVFSSCYRKPDAKPENFITQIETTPTETASRKTSDVVLKESKLKTAPRENGIHCGQRKLILIHELFLFILGAENRHHQHLDYSLINT